MGDVPKKDFSTKEVAKLFDCTPRAVQYWAADNGVRYTGEGKRRDYHFTEADIERFRGRPGPGRRWNTDEKNDLV